MYPAQDIEMSRIERLMWDVYGHVRDRGVPVYEGGASVAEATYLRDLARSSESAVVAEIGFNVGFSAIAFLESSAEVRVVSFELDLRRSVELAKDFVDERYPGRHELIVGDSARTVPGYSGQSCDLLFVDGGHDYDIAYADIVNGRGITRPGGLVVVDDLVPWYPWGTGPYQAWQEAVARGYVEPVERFVDGRPVEVIEPPGDRAWATGRYVP
ncbi:class I SAM-dependent methyltransferase [Amycolatopsis suaedae]|nr:class I SAM-dependent methyltransferase [Amycolatopsis suaedae]